MEQTASTALVTAIIAVVLGALGLIGGAVGYVQGTAALRRATITRQRAAAAEEAALQARTQAEQAARTAQSVLDRLIGLRSAGDVADLPTGPLVLPSRAGTSSEPALTEPGSALDAEVPLEAAAGTPLTTAASAARPAPALREAASVPTGIGAAGPQPDQQAQPDSTPTSFTSAPAALPLLEGVPAPFSGVAARDPLSTGPTRVPTSSGAEDAEDGDVEPSDADADADAGAAVDVDADAAAAVDAGGGVPLGKSETGEPTTAAAPREGPELDAAPVAAAAEPVPFASLSGRVVSAEPTAPAPPVDVDAHPSEAAEPTDDSMSNGSTEGSESAGPTDESGSNGPTAGSASVGSEEGSVSAGPSESSSPIGPTEDSLRAAPVEGSSSPVSASAPADPAGLTEPNEPIASIERNELTEPTAPTGDPSSTDAASSTDYAGAEGTVRAASTPTDDGSGEAPDRSAPTSGEPAVAQRSSTGQVTAGTRGTAPMDWAEALRTGAIPLPARSRGTYSAPSKAKGQPIGPPRFEIRAVGRQRYEAINVGGATAEQASLEGAGDDSHLVRPVEARPKPVVPGSSLAFSVLRVEGRDVAVRIMWMLNGDEEQIELPVP